MAYDICVNYDVLCNLQYKLELIEHDLLSSVAQMEQAIRKSQDYLAGYQFEKAKSTTEDCIALTEKTINRIRCAKEYLEELKMILKEYGFCAYSGGKS